MKIAISTTVRNEASLLRSNILYHRHIGIDRFYVFLDYTTDNTAETIRDLDSVKISESVRPEKLSGRPELRDLVKGAQKIFTARQGLNVTHSLDMARDEGIDWLISLDTDELISIPRFTKHKGGLSEFFSGLNGDIEAVQFDNLEAVQTRLDCKNPFTQENLFLTPTCNLPRRIYNPYRNSVFTLRGFLGHKSGKIAVNTRVKTVPRSSHTFFKYDGSALKIYHAEYLLHYYCCGLNDFIKKYRNFVDHPDTFLYGGEVESQKRLWRDLVNDSRFSDEYIREYYKNCLMPDSETVQKHLGRRLLGPLSPKPKIIEINSVKDVFERLSTKGTLVQS